VPATSITGLGGWELAGVVCGRELAGVVSGWELAGVVCGRELAGLADVADVADVADGGTPATAAAGLGFGCELCPAAAAQAVTLPTRTAAAASAAIRTLSRMSPALAREDNHRPLVIMSSARWAASVAVRPYRSAGTVTMNGTDGSYPRNLPPARYIQADSARARARGAASKRDPQTAWMLHRCCLDDIDAPSMSFACARPGSQAPHEPRQPQATPPPLTRMPAAWSRSYPAAATG
jgi:hypothetical protein